MADAAGALCTCCASECVPCLSGWSAAGRTARRGSQLHTALPGDRAKGERRATYFSTCSGRLLQLEVAAPCAPSCYPMLQCRSPAAGALMCAIVRLPHDQGY